MYFKMMLVSIRLSFEGVQRSVEITIPLNNLKMHVRNRKLSTTLGGNATFRHAIHEGPQWLQ